MVWVCQSHAESRECSRLEDSKGMHAVLSYIAATKQDLRVSRQPRPSASIRCIIALERTGITHSHSQHVHELFDFISTQRASLISVHEVKNLVANTHGHEFT